MAPNFSPKTVQIGAQTVQNDPKTVQNNPKRLKMIKNGSKRSKRKKRPIFFKAPPRRWYRGRSSGGRRTVIGGARVSSAAPKKKSFDRGGPVWPPRSNVTNDRLREGLGGSAPQPKIFGISKKILGTSSLLMHLFITTVYYPYNGLLMVESAFMPLQLSSSAGD